MIALNLIWGMVFLVIGQYCLMALFFMASGMQIRPELMTTEARLWLAFIAYVMTMIGTAVIAHGIYTIKKPEPKP